MRVINLLICNQVTFAYLYSSTNITESKDFGDSVMCQQVYSKQSLANPDIHGTIYSPGIISYQTSLSKSVNNRDCTGHSSHELRYIITAVRSRIIDKSDPN